MDAKKRVFVPAVFRRTLLLCQADAANTGNAAETADASQTSNALQAPNASQAAANTVLYIRKDVYQNCLVLYPEPVWEAELSALRASLNKWVPAQQEVYRQFLLEAETVEMDAAGRILLPKRLLEMVGIGSQVRFLGVDDTIEIWPKEALEQPRMAPEEFQRQLQALLGNQ